MKYMYNILYMYYILDAQIRRFLFENATYKISVCSK